MVNISYVFNVSVESGPSDTFNNKLTIDAYNKISVTVPPSTVAAPTTPVSLQPVSSDKVKFLCIKSDFHSQSKEKKVTCKAAVYTHYYTSHSSCQKSNLISTKLLIGSSLIKLLGDVKSLTFMNTFDKDAHIEILVGREI